MSPSPVPFPEAKMIRIVLNGESRLVPDGLNVMELLINVGVDPERVAVELNRRLVKSERYDQPLKAGDEVEIVTFVGGG